nr:glycosyltransferase [Anaerolineae bacterium]
VALMRNYGQHNALLCGIRMASFDTVVTMDDDLQHPPSEIKKLLAKLDEGYDVVYGYPEAEQHGLWRDLASQITKIVLRNIMGIGTARHVSAFRAFTTRLRHAFEGYRGPFVSIDVLLTWGTSRFAAIPVRHELRQHGKSNYTFGKLVTHAFNMMTGFSTIPLQIASYTGFAFTAFGGVVLIYVLLCTLINRTAPSGWPFLASIIAIFSGVQMFSLGIIGEYLARMHFRMMDRPPYAIYGVINPPPEHE